MENISNLVALEEQHGVVQVDSRVHVTRDKPHLVAHFQPGFL
eukprot:CAMPEP_0175988210 /NCGR_PEP_ID=MMETSP0108-20121206/51128_1 /TAXON_ID=195067 ORGANISM="Goniomonas pacifica, Strain CCMP1869" /NCGR_SAMPLE_ID=MMETSP0108 /ASSEMBLY_ACC=CAM_ASM_000204 /LENGTH=41 /DNA_ID= /DNA_START= /DNA_END= /DNA_ORIENTATION=